MTPLVEVKGVAIHHLMIDPKGRYLFALAEGGEILIYRIKPNGQTRYAGTTTVIGTYGTALTSDGDRLGGATDESIMAFDPDGHHATLSYNTGFVDHSEFQIARYRVLKNGHFQLLGEPSYEHGGMSAICTSPDGKYIYLTCSRYDDITNVHTDGIREYRVRPDGRLTPLSPPLIHAELGEAVVDPQGHFLYAEESKYAFTGQPDQRLFGYLIRPNGTLSRPMTTLVPGLPHLLPEPSGRFLYAFGSMADPRQGKSVTAFRVETDGRLFPIMRPLLSRSYIIAAVTAHTAPRPSP